MIRDFLHAALATLLILGFYGAFLVVAWCLCAFGGDAQDRGDEIARERGQL